MSGAARAIIGSALVVLLSGCAWIERSSVASDPTPGVVVQGNGASSSPSISQTGRFVAFTSAATNLVAADGNGVADVFVRDHATRTTERVSIASDGAESNGASNAAAISDDGRFVAFATLATNLFPGDTDGRRDVVVRDRTLGTTTLVSIAPDGSPVTDEAVRPAISGDGSRVAFVVNASVGSFCCAAVGPFVRDLGAETTTRMPASGLALNGQATLSDDGTRIGYGSVVPSSDPTAETGTFAALIADVATATVVAVVDQGTVGPASFFDLALSGDGEHVAYLFGTSAATTLSRFDVSEPGLVPLLEGLPGATRPAISDDGTVIAVRTQPSGSTSRYVVTDDHGAGPTAVSADPAWRVAPDIGDTDLSGDGEWASFDASSAALVGGDTNGQPDVFTRSVRPASAGPS